MRHLALITPPTLVFIFLWWSIGRYAGLSVKFLNRLRHALPFEGFNFTRVFWAETTDGKEAEFADNRPYDKQRIVRFWRAAIAVFYLLTIISLIMTR